MLFSIYNLIKGVETMKREILQNRVECMNKVNNYINRVVPALLKELDKGFSITNSLQFFKKDKSRFDTIMGNHSRAYIAINKYSIGLKVSDHYSVGKHSCDYYDQYIYLYNRQSNECIKPEALECVTLKQLEDAQKRQAELEDQQGEINSEMFKVKQLLGR